MHSLAPYSLRVYNPQLPGTIEDKYHKLNDIRKLDLFDLILNFANSHSTEYVLIDENKAKKTIKFTDVTVDGRNIYGFIETGDYGIKGKVISITTGDTVYAKTINDSDINQLYFHFSIPVESTVGICTFHNIHGRGVKGIFEQLFNDAFHNQTKGLRLQMKPVTYEKVVIEWMKNADVKELRLQQYTPKDQFTDVADKLAEHVSTLTIKPKKKGGVLGTYWSFHKSDEHTGENRGAIESMEEHCQSVKAVVEFDRRKRVFSLAANSNPISSVEFDEDDVTMEGGAPVLQSLHKYSELLIKDLFSTT